ICRGRFVRGFVQVSHCRCYPLLLAVQPFMKPFERSSALASPHTVGGKLGCSRMKANQCDDKPDGEQSNYCALQIPPVRLANSLVSPLERRHYKNEAARPDQTQAR